MTEIKQNDFLELEFTGFANGEIFDTTDNEKAKTLGIDGNVKPIIISVGNNMLIKGFDNDLIGKEIGSSYKVILEPKDAFGLRDSSLVKTVSLKAFKENKMNPYPGMVLRLDNSLAKVLSVNSGRVTIDFNNPLSGKPVEYHYKILRKVDDIKEKVDSLLDYFLKSRFDYDIEDNKVIFKKAEIKPFIDVFSERFKNITGYEFLVNEKSN